MGRRRTPPEVGAAIERCRKAQGLTRAELGLLLGLSELSIWRIERGRQGVSLDRLRLVATFFDRPVDYFMHPGPPEAKAS